MDMNGDTRRHTAKIEYYKGLDRRRVRSNREKLPLVCFLMLRHVATSELAACSYILMSRWTCT
jgi:hypothetical protein